MHCPAESGLQQPEDFNETFPRMSLKGKTAMADCEYIRTCPLFQRFHLESTRNVWIAFYCKNDEGVDCARKALRKQGQPPQDIPADLLPNGDRLGA
jgi:hypothetical protein